MGILNVTPDSFHSDSRMLDSKSLLQLAEKMLLDGATLLDIGGYSSRPNADEVSESEEINRVIPSIELLNMEFPQAMISIDTFRSKVAQKAMEAGACIINDISGGSLDEQMFETVAKSKAVYIMTHMRGTPQTMSGLTDYDDLLMEMMDFYVDGVEKLSSLQVADIIIDPGFGFAKTINQNYEILKNLQYFQQLNLPLLAGISRKSMIYKALDIGSADALNGTTALHMIALMNGASILRAHDVKEATETIKLYSATYE